MKSKRLNKFYNLLKNNGILIFVGATLVGSLSVKAYEPLPSMAPVPADNIMSPEKIALGKELFFEKRISKTMDVSCNTCHNVMGSGTDNARFSTGINHQLGGRNSPTVWNAAFSSVQFWDGRAKSLEDQAKGPMINPLEMGMPNHEEVIKRLSAIKSYREKFEKVFGAKGLNIDNVAKAIAAFERTLITPNSNFDKYVKGDLKALNAKALNGLKLVENVGCVSCHSGPNFSGPQMPEGQGLYQKFPVVSGSEFEKKYELTKDQGRFAATKLEQDKNMWKVPTWRNVARTAPYFHNGSVQTLDEAVRVMAKTQLGKTLKDSEVEDIVEFLKSLNGELPKIEAVKN